jgi:hypothetical protein
MQTRSRELPLALLAIIFITILYLLMLFLNRQSPAANSFYGHTMGIFGFMLMLVTETLYSLRKRLVRASWGKMASWLEFHIFTGLVGPYMVLLHTSWQFNGLAGILMLLTILIVVSGVIGRYIYTAVPRTDEGAELGLADIEQQILAVEVRLSRMAPNSQKTVPVKKGSQLILTRALDDIKNRFEDWQRERLLTGENRQHAVELDRLVSERVRLRRQAASLSTARRLLALWHAIHIPLGLTLFAMAIVHISAAIYYATLLH